MSRDAVSTHIPGALDWRTLAERADRHRPRDPGVLAAELRRLRSTGLTPRDLASAMRMPLATVHELLAEQRPLPFTEGGSP